MFPREVRSKGIGLKHTMIKTTFLVALHAIAASAFALVSARYLVPSARGTFALVMTTGSLTMLIGARGRPTVARQSLSAEDGRYSPRLYLRDVSKLALIYMPLGSASLGVVLLTAEAWPGVVEYALAILIVLSLLLNYTFREGLHGVGRHEFAIGSDVTSALGQLATLVAAQSALARVDIVHVLAISACWLAMQATVLAIALARHPWAAERNVGDSVPVAAASTAAMFGAVGQAGAIRGDRLLLGLIAGPAPVGTYAVIASLTDLMQVGARGAGQLAFRRSAAGDRKAVARLLQMTLALTMASGLVIAFTARPVIRHLIGPDYVPSPALVASLAFAGIPLTIFLFLSSALNGMGEFNAVARNSMLGVPILVVGCLVLVPNMGADGAGLASAAAYSTMALAMGLYYRKSGMRIPPRRRGHVRPMTVTRRSSEIGFPPDCNNGDSSPYEAR
jgi:O-antigen/teichoic acid export membrane protein